MKRPERVSLRDEIEYIFATVFGVVPDTEAIVRYERFHEIYSTELKACRQVSLSRMVARELDLEAIEYFVRTRSPDNLLSRKLWTCSYLFEAQTAARVPGLVPESNVANSPFRCLVMLAWFGFRSVVKWLKGALQVYCYRLA